VSTDWSVTPNLTSSVTLVLKKQTFVTIVAKKARVVKLTHECVNKSMHVKKLMDFKIINAHM